LLRATLLGAAEVDAYEMDLKRAGLGTRRLVLTAHRLSYADEGNKRLLLTVLDVTDARLAERLKDDLLREKALLFQELQHRVANSLQIIASVLMLSARRASSDMQGPLYDAHNRVMSVAKLQQHLAASSLGDVPLRAYFTELCASIADSMISDPLRLELSVEADDSVASPDASVSLGLIVTELVINALKHAFPGGRAGRIVVGYQSSAPDWTLSVRDNGVGMPRGPEPAISGLGSSIVEALAKQLQAAVETADADPGASISVVHAAKRIGIAGVQATPAV
jgi:two-component sensor histidine kinase